MGVFMPKLYLSPSKQPHNMYADGKTTEEKSMNIVTDYLVAFLKGYDVEVIRGSKTVEIRDRIIQANKLNLDYYLSLHSNAGGGSGCETYYQVGNTHSTTVKNKSKQFAEQLNLAFSKITPTNSRVGDRGVKYKTQSNGSDYNMEIRGVNVPTNLIEIEFHDTVNGSKWILANQKLIGETIGKSLVHSLGLVLATSDDYYYVQTGAYPTLAEAEFEAKKVTTATQQVVGIKFGDKNAMDWIKSVPVTDKPVVIIKEVIRYVDKIIEVEKPFKESFERNGLKVTVEKVV